MLASSTSTPNIKKGNSMLFNQDGSLKKIIAKVGSSFIGKKSGKVYTMKEVGPKGIIVKVNQ